MPQGFAVEDKYDGIRAQVHIGGGKGEHSLQPEGEGSYRHGHDFASGGSLPITRWQELLNKLGFDVDTVGAG